MPSVSSRLPSLGPRGEGWVAGQFLLIAIVVAVGWHDRDIAALRHSRVRRVLAVVGATSVVAGTALAVVGARDLGPNLTPMPRPLADAHLVQSGIYGRIRHPLYAAVMLVTLGWAAATASMRALATAGVLAVWLDAKARREEAWLLEQFPGYAEYMTRTARFVPRIY